MFLYYTISNIYKVKHVIHSTFIHYIFITNNIKYYKLKYVWNILESNKYLYLILFFQLSYMHVQKFNVNIFIIKTHNKLTF